MAQQTNRLERPRQAEKSEMQPKQIRKDVLAYLRDYARENPEITALWCLGIGFVLGWKLKPW